MTVKHLLGAQLILLFVPALVGAGCGGGGDSSAAAVSTNVDVRAIVTAENAPPTGTRFAEAFAGRQVVTMPFENRQPEVHRAVRAGVVEAFARMFISPGLARAAEQGTLAAFVAQNVDRPGTLAIASAAARYEDEEAADEALEVYLGELGARPGLRRVYDTGLGDDRGGIFEGRAREHADIPKRIYVWRTGSLLLYLSADGSIEADREAIRALAEGMETRATER